jgi:GT2 family glycosyltransferase
VIEAVIVPTLNQTDKLCRLLDSIDRPVGDVVIIDNGVRWPRGSRLDVPRVRDCRSQTVIEIPHNLGVAGSWNLGIKVTPHADRWLIVNDDSWLEPGSLQVLDSESDRWSVTTAQIVPPWSCFVIGDDVVRRVGLFDERLYPAYFEDTDYARRCELAGVTVRPASAPVQHDNSSTLASGVGRGDTYMDNLDLHHRKATSDDLSWGWDLDRRRSLDWEITDAR